MSRRADAWQLAFALFVGLFLVAQLGSWVFVLGWLVLSVGAALVTGAMIRYADREQVKKIKPVNPYEGIDTVIKELGHDAVVRTLPISVRGDFLTERQIKNQENRNAAIRRDVVREIPSGRANEGPASDPFWAAFDHSQKQLAMAIDAAPTRRERLVFHEMRCDWPAGPCICR